MSGLSPRARALFERARAEGTPTARERERLYARLDAAIAAGSAPNGSAANGGAPSEPPAPAAGTAAPAGATLASVSTAALGIVAALAALTALTVLLTPPAPVPVPKSEPDSPSGPASDSAPALVPDAEPEPAPEPVPVPVPVPVPDSAASSARPLRTTAPVADLAAELALLRRAQAARVDARYSDALGVLAEHEARFPHGALAREREIARALVLCESGDVARGRALALRLGPSAWSGSIARACGDTHDDDARGDAP